MDCFGTDTLHMSKPNVTRVQSATECIAENIGTYLTHVQTCDVTRVQSATEWIIISSRFTFLTLQL